MLQNFLINQRRFLALTTNFDNNSGAWCPLSPPCHDTNQLCQLILEFMISRPISMWTTSFGVQKLWVWVIFGLVIWWPRFRYTNVSVTSSSRLAAAALQAAGHPCKQQLAGLYFLCLDTLEFGFCSNVFLTDSVSLLYILLLFWL